VTKKILVVDDTELIRMIYRDRLRQEGYEVVLASDGIEGLQTAVSEQPDLVLLDLVMPRQNGLDTLRQLKEDPRTQNIPVIILSNRDDQEEIKTGLRLGAEDFLKKVGAAPTEVTEKIKLVLSRSDEAAQADAASSGPIVRRVFVRDREADAEALTADLGLQRRYWCPACEQELQLELIVDPSGQGGHWFKAHLVCPGCSKSF
jgi:DNA-binding response OmpR family regulator